MKRLHLSVSAALLFSSLIAGANPAPDAKADARPRVQIALLLDTSNSMDGLISQAKSQLWKVVNEFIAAKQDGRAPDVEVALFEYGNSRLDAKQGYIRLVQPLTHDLDTLSEQLFALQTSGGSEYCGWVIHDAVQRLQWDPSPKAYKAIFIAGNESFTQGKIPYAKACKDAVEKGIIVNTIHCGSVSEGIEGKWKDGAALADGRFLTIDQDARIADIEAPQDKEIAELNSRLNSTYIAYGRKGAEGAARQAKQDANTLSAQAPAEVSAQRIRAKASKNYKNSTWDLVDASKEKGFDLAKVKDEDLPKELRKLDLEKRKEFIAQKDRERAEIQARVSTLIAEREKYVASKMKEAGEASTLDKAVLSAVREQASKKQFTFESK